MQVSKNGSRVETIGRSFRKTNLDELPQFLDVLKGEMSVIRPCPLTTSLNLESKGSVRHDMMRQLFKPRVTGWTLVNGYRGETRDPELMQKRVKHDIWDIENWSFWLDIQIAFTTIWKIFTGINPKIIRMKE